MSRLVYDNLADHVLDLVFPIFKGLAADRSIELEGKQLWSISGDNWQQVTFPAATTFSYWEKNIPIRGPLDSSCNSILLVSQSCKRFVLYKPALCLGVSIIDNVKWAYVRDMKLWSEEIAQEFSCKLAIFISASLEHSQSSWFEITGHWTWGLMVSQMAKLSQSHWNLGLTFWTWAWLSHWHLGSSTSFMWGITSLVSIEALTLDQEEN